MERQTRPAARPTKGRVAANVAKSRAEGQAARPAGPAPTRAQLHEAALRHLSRFATTQAGLVRVLDRRVDRWSRTAAAEAAGGTDPVTEQTRTSRQAVREVAAALVASGVIDDAAFAQARSARLSRAGRSRRAVTAHLVGKGIASDVAQAALPAPEQEFATAVAFTRRRRMGPFRSADAPADDDAARLRELGALARAGFPRDLAERALALERDEADALVLAMKQG